ncbi:MAG: hypothetical protein KGL45_11605 [Gammaproteobacteria bacterium]|nr:hypothetical protein [Gammaproteobacteria bacterium]MDE2263161.1 hypothetical protein [Gammaproteobacteria bacterium]
MRSAHRIGIAAVTVALAMGWAVGRAGDPPQQTADPAVDPGLLEFLGSGDPSSDSTQPDDGSWLAYLSEVNIGKVAKAARAPQAPVQPKPASSPAGADKPSG